MTVEPVHLDEGSFFELVAEPAPSVVFVSCHRLHTFNQALPERLASSGVEGASFGSLPFSELLTHYRVLEFLVRAKASASSPYPGVLPGYYMFVESELLAYDAALPQRADTHQLLSGALLGAALFRLTGSAGHLFRALVTAANGASSRRVAEHFARVAAERAARASEPPRAAEPSSSELDWAYHTLGVRPEATDAEVNQAWRRLRAQHHPDHAAADPAEFARRSQRSRELNRARDVIFSQRARARSAA